MEAEKFLEQMRKIDDLIKSLEEEYDKLITRATNIAVKYRDVVAHSGECSSPQEQNGQEMAEYSSKIKDMQKELNAYKNRAMDIIRQIQPIKYQVILIKYYIQNKTIERSAEEMQTSSRWAAELKKRAVKEFAKKYK